MCTGQFHINGVVGFVYVVNQVAGNLLFIVSFCGNLQAGCGVCYHIRAFQTEFAVDGEWRSAAVLNADINQFFHVAEFFDTYFVPYALACTLFVTFFHIEYNGVQTGIVRCDGFRFFGFGGDMCFLIRGQSYPYGVGCQHAEETVFDTFFFLFMSGKRTCNALQIKVWTTEGYIAVHGGGCSAHILYGENNIRDGFFGFFDIYCIPYRGVGFLLMSVFPIEVHACFADIAFVHMLHAQRTADGLV